MSRIAGIVSRRSNIEINNMLACQKTPTLLKSWNNYIYKNGKSIIGYTGAYRTSAANNENVSVIIDGSIYNSNELGQGGDAEIIIKLYKRYGFPELLTKLNGDFSIALQDSISGELWLARDRVGVKPLYFTRLGAEFAFASRCKALLEIAEVPKEVDPQYVALVAASHYRHFDNQPEKSPYKGIDQLPAANWLRFKNGECRTGIYWQLEDLPEWEESEEELAERYRELLLNSTCIRMDRCVKPGFTLSGGMDSSSVIGSAVSETGEKQKAFSSIYADKTFDESEDISTILDVAVSKWHQVSVSNPDVYGLIEKMVEVNDEPVATATWLSHFVVCEQAAKEGITHLFGGLGGDELNAGEYEHFFPFFADLKIGDQKKRLDKEVLKWIEYHTHPLYPKNFAVMEETVARICDLNKPGKIRPDRQRLERYHELLNPDFFDLSAFEPVMDHPFQSYLKNRCYQDIFRETSPCCLRAQDRQGMALGIQHVMPFFDHRIIEFMFRVPAVYKYSNGVTKSLLRKATAGLIPESTRKRIKKTGWNAPAHLWFSGEGAEKIRDLVASTKFKELGIYRPEAVHNLLNDHLEIVEQNQTRENHMMLFWQLVNLVFWVEGI
jgi:asparagine synthase (glutamine-hydrolysing)